MKHDEDRLQGNCNAYLDLLALRYIHMPKDLQRHIWAKGCGVPIHVAARASKALKGVPDLLIFGTAGRCLIVELKAAKGTLTPEQKTWIPNGLVVCRTFDEFRATVDVWNKGNVCRLNIDAK